MTKRSFSELEDYLERSSPHRHFSFVQDSLQDATVPLVKVIGYFTDLLVTGEPSYHNFKSRAWMWKENPLRFLPRRPATFLSNFCLLPCFLQRHIFSLAGLSKLLNPVSQTPTMQLAEQHRTILADLRNSMEHGFLICYYMHLVVNQRRVPDILLHRCRLTDDGTLIDHIPKQDVPHHRNPPLQVFPYYREPEPRDAGRPFNPLDLPLDPDDDRDWDSERGSPMRFATSDMVEPNPLPVPSLPRFSSLGSLVNPIILD